MWRRWRASSAARRTPTWASRAIWWLAALAGEHNKYDGKVWDYQPVWGTGNGIVELTPNPRKELDFEKEFDEGPVEQGTGLESHNVVEMGRDDRRDERGYSAEPKVAESSSTRLRSSMTPSSFVPLRRLAPIPTPAGSAICCSCPASVRAGR